MHLFGFNFEKQLSAGKDGVCYLARDPSTDAQVEVVDLTAARQQPRRWRRYVQRLQKVALISHPRAVRLRDVITESVPPGIVRQWRSHTPLVSFLANVPDRRAFGIRLVHSLADLLAVSHRMDVVHGQLTPDCIRIDEDAQAVVDFTDFLDLGNVAASTTDPGVPAPGSPSDIAGDPSTSDVYALGSILRLVVGTDMSGRLHELTGAMMAEDPYDRPLAEEVRDAMGDTARRWDVPLTIVITRPEPSHRSTRPPRAATTYDPISVGTRSDGTNSSVKSAAVQRESFTKRSMQPHALPLPSKFFTPTHRQRRPRFVGFVARQRY